jgi:hypothetical protein
LLFALAAAKLAEMQFSLRTLLIVMLVVALAAAIASKPRPVIPESQRLNGDGFSTLLITRAEPSLRANIALGVVGAGCASLLLWTLYMDQKQARQRR